ncbi:MAG TPA: hypothetical protein VM621_18885 [Luteibacter sp.]|uniref:hypothetical protein n=1 Tax=Luteibacter sp. TaxID=1886636 RepID=UPI002C280D55|nr:hypothetical protein [Luteibacter sp.]HVI57114.1 hypothetical protein [Luteibacter sp.]
MSESNVPLMIDWELMDNVERTVWATTFAMRFPDVSVESAAGAAARCVTAIRLADPARNPPLDPVTRIAGAAIVISLDEFAVWYQVELRLQAGRWKEPLPLSAEQIEQAYERFARGRSDFY